MLTKQALEYLKLGTGGSYSLARDAIAHRVWDTRSFAATALSNTFFSQPVGGPWIGGVAKTLNETNLYSTGQLPNGQTFLVNKIGIAVTSNYQTTIQQADVLMQRNAREIIQSSVFEITLAGRSFDFQAHGRQFISMPFSSMCSDTMGSLTAAGRIGDYIAAGWIKLDPTPIFLDQLVSFSVTQTIQNPVAALKTALDAASASLSTYNATLMVILDGFLTRAK